MRTVTDRNIRAYRMGGDEFTVIMANEKVKENVTDKGYSVSVGYVMTQGYKELEEAVKASDKFMYKAKAQYYEESGTDRRARK